MNHIRRGTGKPLLLIHGLGESWKSWEPVLDGLSKTREVIAVDLPGFGKTPLLSGKQSINALADALIDFIAKNNLTGTDAVGISMGGRLALELARRGGILGAVVALAPACYWKTRKRPYLTALGYLFRFQIRLLRPVLPLIVKTKAGRKIFLGQVTEYPEKATPKMALDEMLSYGFSPATIPYLKELMSGPDQPGAPLHSIKNPLVIGWGRQDKVCYPEQAAFVLEHFPDAKLHWFEECGHLSIWDKPEEVVELILKTTTV